MLKINIFIVIYCLYLYLVPVHPAHGIAASFLNRDCSYPSYFLSKFSSTIPKYLLSVT